MNTQGAFILSLLTFINLSCEESVMKEVQVRLKEDTKSNQLNRDLYYARQLGDSNAEFALDLYREFIGDSETGGKNIFLSPFSISACLGMILFGANTNTAKQMTDVLHYEVVNDMVHEAFRETLEILNRTSNQYELRVANRLFAGDNLEPKPSYAYYIERFYGASLQMLDFHDDDSRILINNWVANQTNGHITDLLPQGSLDPDNPLVIINAIYFKGPWMIPFPAHRTKRAFFYTGTDGGEFEVDMMVNSGVTFNYTHTDQLGGAAVVELPYVGKDVSMYILLPDLYTGLPEVERQITVPIINQVIGSMQEKKLQSIEIPKFSIKDKKDLRNYLMRLGLTDVFSEQRELGGIMFDCPKIEEVYHEAYIDVSEEGTEAAGATAGAGRRNAQLYPITFNVDRPFLFFIRENPTKSLLFLGRFMNPDAN